MQTALWADAFLLCGCHQKDNVPYAGAETELVQQTLVPQLWGLGASLTQQAQLWGSKAAPIQGTRVTRVARRSSYHYNSYQMEQHEDT